MKILIVMAMLLCGGAAMAQTAPATDPANLHMHGGQVEAEGANQSQDVLEAAQNELAKVKTEMANLQRELEKKQQEDPGPAGSLQFLLLVALGVFAAGMLTGALILRSHYHKRLNGLRI